MNRRSKTWLWRLAKLMLAAAILWGVGRQFYRDLSAPTASGQPDLRELHFRPGWLVVSGALYLMALSFSAYYWYRLLYLFGHRPRFYATYRAYFLGMLGKYVPGKAWALFLRGILVVRQSTNPGSGGHPERKQESHVQLGTAIVTAFYEVLTTMSAGALIAAVVFLVWTPQLSGYAWSPLFTGVLLLGLCGLPLLPVVFNYLTGRLARRFVHLDSLAWPKLGAATLLEGILITSCGWALMGISVWALFQSVLPEPPALTLVNWLQFCASTGLAYVAGFLAFVLPSGVGVREYFLRELLAFTGPDQWVAAAVLLLRLVWTAAELALAGILLIVRPTKAT